VSCCVYRVGFGTTNPAYRAKLEDRKVKINGNKAALAISQIGMLNSQGIPDRPPLEVLRAEV
jgi:hypothetical protein